MAEGFGVPGDGLSVFRFLPCGVWKMCPESHRGLRGMLLLPSSAEEPAHHTRVCGLMLPEVPCPPSRYLQVSVSGCGGHQGSE